MSLKRDLRIIPCENKFTCMEMDSKQACTNIIPGTEAKLTGIEFPYASFSIVS